MALKVCQLCAVDFTLQHFLLPLIDGMESAGWRVTAVCSDGEHVGGLRKRGYRITVLPIARNFNLLTHVRTLWALFRLFRRERFDVVHVHTPIAALLGRIAARWASVPLVVYTAHGFYFHDEMPRWKRSLFVLLEKIGGSVTHLLFTQSEEDALAAVNECICPAKDVLAIGNGVDVARFDPARVAKSAEIRRALGIPDGASVVGIIGRLVREKGYSEFLEAAQLLGVEFEHAYFLVVGSRLASDHDDPIDSVLSQAKDVLGNRLILAGFRMDTPEMLSVMDVFCLPSYREGMPRTIIEAMMMGKPVVATNIRGAREEVVEGKTGWLVPTRDADALAQTIRYCLQNPVQAREMGEAGRRRALALYDEQKVIALQIGKIEAYAKKRGLSVG
jgi:glycosyltransferase involved in cell wall biosynthesis